MEILRFSQALFSCFYVNSMTVKIYISPTGHQADYYVILSAVWPER